MLPKRISNPFMNKLLSSILIRALRCPLPQPPQGLLVSLKRFPFPHDFLDVFTDTLSIFLLLSITYGFLIDFQVDLYLHLDCIFTYTLLTMFFTLHIPIVTFHVFIDFSTPSLSTFQLVRICLSSILHGCRAMYGS